MAIEFNLLQANVRVPGTNVEIDNSRAVQGTLIMPSRVLHYAQMLASGTATAGEIVRVTNAGQASALFGRGSMAAAMVKTHFKAAAFIDLFVLPLADDVDGTQATRTITVTAGPVAAGTLYVYIAERRYSVGVGADDTAADVASGIAEAIGEDAESYMTAEAVDAVVTLTARHAGVDAGNFIVQHSYYQGENLPPGVALTIGAATVGTGNPEIAPAIDAIGDEWFQTFVTPWTDGANLRALEADLAERFGPQRQIEGHSYAATDGSVSTVATFGEGRNSPHLCVADAGVTVSPAWLLAAADGALDAAETDPARPRQTLQLPAELLPVKEAVRRIHTERNTLLYSGIATHTVNAAGRIQIERLVTTYQTGNQGIEDESYLDVETLRTVAYMRYDFRRMIALKYPRHKLADNGTPIAPGQPIVTPNVIRGETIALFQDWMEIGIAENLEQFKRDAVFERSSSDPNAINAIIPPDCINQLRRVNALLQFRV